MPGTLARIMLDIRCNAETAASLKARAECCRALSRVAYLPFAAGMLLSLAQQLEGEADRSARACGAES
jgi:hypothetical protein